MSDTGVSVSLGGWCATLLLPLMVLVGCAAPPGSREAAGPAPSTGAVTPQRWVSYAADVVAVHPGRTGRDAIIEVRLPGSRVDCGRDPQVSYVEEEQGLFHLTVVFSAASNPRDSCASSRLAEVTFNAPASLSGRTLVINNESFWQQTGTDYRKCDERLGCDPPTDHCDPAWRDLVLGHLDVPRHSGVSTRACDGHWMVVDIDVGPSSCTRINAAVNGCRPTSNVTRWFLRFTGTRWEIITGTTRTGGCSVVQAEDPNFPTTLCQDLSAPA